MVKYSTIPAAQKESRLIRIGWMIYHQQNFTPMDIAAKK